MSKNVIDTDTHGTSLHSLSLFCLIRVSLRNPSSPTGLRRTGPRLEVESIIHSFYAKQSQSIRYAYCVMRIAKGI